MPHADATPHSKVAAALRRRRLSYRRAAEKLPASFSMISQVATGKADPGLRLAVAFERAYGIRVEEWDNLRESVGELLRLRGAA